jgi:type IV pilus assembly protein PilM
VFERQSIFPIAIDIGSQNLFAAQFQQPRQGLEVSGLFHREFDTNAQDPAAIGKLMLPRLREMVKSNRFRGKKAALHLPSHDILSFPIRFKCDRPQDLEPAIVQETTKYLPFPVEEAIIDYPSVTEGKADQFKATVIAAHRDHIKAYLNMARQAGLAVETVDFHVSSLLRLHRHLFDLSLRPDILCHVGQAQTLLAVATADSIVAQRYVPWGLQVLLEKIAANLALSDGRRNLKMLLRNYGLSFKSAKGEDSTDRFEARQADETDSMGRVIHQILAPNMEELIHELHKLIGYVRSEEQNSTFDNIYVYGQGTLVRDLDRYLESRLDISTQLVNPLATMTMTNDSFIDRSEGGPFALAMGLALRKVTWL